jgi:uncharacterized glyoxalase superfamily protein PhnB
MPLIASELTASFTVRDCETSLAWYRDVLGFELNQRHEREGVLRAASIRAGSVRLLLVQDDGAKGLDRVKGEGFSVQITTTMDIDALAADIASRGGTLESPPATIMGARAFRIVDPDGFRIAFSSPR